MAWRRSWRRCRRSRPPRRTAKIAETASKADNIAPWRSRTAEWRARRRAQSKPLFGANALGALRLDRSITIAGDKTHANRIAGFRHRYGLISAGDRALFPGPIDCHSNSSLGRERGHGGAIDAIAVVL